MRTSSAYSLLFIPYLIVGTTNIETHSTVPIEVDEDERWNFVVIQPGEEIEIVCSRPSGGLVWRLPSNNDLFGFDNIDFKSRVTEGELAGDKQARSLRITRAQSTDSGFYKCHELENKKNYWEVYVYVKGDDPFLKPANDSLVMSVGFIVPCRSSSHVKRNSVTLFINGVAKPDLTERYDSRIGFKLYQHDLRHEIVHQRMFRCEMNGKSVDYYVEDPKLANFDDVKLEISRTLISGTPSLFSINCSLHKVPRIDLVSKHRLEIGCASCVKKHPSVHQQLKNHSTIIVNTAPSIMTTDDKYFCEWYIEKNGVYTLHKSIALDMNIPTGKLESAGVLTSSFVGLLLTVICVVVIAALVSYLLWNRRRRNETNKKELELKEIKQMLPANLASAVKTTEIPDEASSSSTTTSPIYDTQIMKKYKEQTTWKLGETNEDAQLWSNTDERVPHQRFPLNSGNQIALADLDLGPEPQLLGGGGQADVYKGRYGGELVAVKKYKPKPGNKHFYDEEVATLLKMRHRNLLQIIGHVDEEWCIVIEYCPSTLYTCINDNSFKLDWILFPEWVNNLVEALYYLHENDIIHRDIKSSNVLVSKDKVLRVCDFGVSRIASITQCTFVTFIGTVGYEAPEMKRRENYTRKVDVYSFGVVLWEMATRRNPNTELVYKPIEESEVTKKKLPPSLLLMISKCTAMNPDERPSFAELREGVLWDAAHSDIRSNRKDWPDEKEDAQLSASGWNYTMNYALPIEHNDKHLDKNK